MNEINPDNAMSVLREGSCSTMMALESVIALDGGPLSTTEIGDSLGVLPSSISNVLRNLRRATDPLVEHIPTGKGKYQLTPHGSAALGAAKTFFGRLDKDPTAPKPQPSDDELLGMGIDPKTGIPWF